MVEFADNFTEFVKLALRDFELFFQCCARLRRRADTVRQMQAFKKQTAENAVDFSDGFYRRYVSPP